MNLIDLSLKRPVFAWVLMFSCIVFGAICMNRMGVSQLPDVDFPVLNISMSYEGAAPEVVESELIDPLEQRLLSVEGIKEMRSQASQGSGMFLFREGMIVSVHCFKLLLCCCIIVLLFIIVVLK